MTRPPPPVDSDADLTSFRDMPLEVVRFAKSDLVAFASADAVLAALMLWGSSWHSRPAGSLTNDDRALMRAAGFGRGAEAAWRDVRDDALRGWYECSDGRLYHPVVAEKVTTAWRSRLKQSHATYSAAIRMHNKRNPDDLRDGLSFEDWLANGRPADAKRAAPKPDQPVLPLPDAGLRVTDDAVTRNANDGSPNGGESFAEKQLQGKGREGKGSEGKGSDSYNDIDDGGGDGLVARAARYASRAGINLSPAYPKPYARELDLVKGWITDGVPEETILAAIDKKLDRLADGETVSTFRFFDQAIRTAHARTARRKPAARATEPAPTLSEGDDDDERIVEVRRQLAASCGTYARWLAPTVASFHVNGVGLVVTARSTFAAERIEAEVKSDLRRVAAAVLGRADVEVRAQ